MYGGLLKSASAVAMIAAAGLFTSANAADLGGDCCADLEERVAELEATTVRKGNRKVSLKISGFVGSQVMWWDDGVRSDTYIGLDGGNIFSRWRFTGEAKISPQVTAGFTYEFGVNRHSITSANQSNGGDDLGECTNSCIRDTTVWIKHAQLGKIKIGQGSTATDNLILIDLGGTGSAATPDNRLFVGSFVIPRNGAYDNQNRTWYNALVGGNSYDTDRRNHVLYETPTIAGFSVQAAVAEDNFWDVALRYAGEFGGIRVAFGIGYLEDSEFNASVAGVAVNQCTTDCNRKESEIKGSRLHSPCADRSVPLWCRWTSRGG
ncbi:MAG: porin [Hyphomicrobiaceae bacterium]